MDRTHDLADLAAIADVVVDSQYFIDTGDCDALADQVFAAEVVGVVPVADFGFVEWRGTEAIRAGFTASLARFEACMHVVSNLRIDGAGDRATARYYVQGWHWVATTAPRERPEADFLVLGIMRDDFVRQDGAWRVARRRLDRVGPSVAVGRLPGFLAGLGE